MSILADLERAGLIRRGLMRTLLSQLAHFGAVGLVGLVVDVTLFNLLRITVLAPEVIVEGPVIAKVISGLGLSSVFRFVLCRAWVCPTLLSTVAADLSASGA